MESRRGGGARFDQIVLFSGDVDFPIAVFEESRRGVFV